MVSTCRGVPTLRDVPSSGFLNLSTAFSTFGFAGFFHPAATSRVSVQGFDPDPQPYRLVAGPCLLALVAHLLTGCPAATQHATELRGFVPQGDTYVEVSG
jgi:hypothetical protein